MKKGLTLIELLAVVVIIAIIVMIAMPTLSGIIFGVKRDAFIESVQIISKVAEHENLNSGAGQIDLTSLKYSGKRYETGSMEQNQDGEIEMLIWNEELKMCAVKRYESESVVINTLLDETTCTNNGPFVAVDLKPIDPLFACYTFDSGTGTITDYDHANPICPLDFYSPTSINGINVLKIGDGINSIAGGKLTSVDLNDAIYLEELDEWVFTGDDIPKRSIKSVSFPDSNSLVAISRGAFYHQAIQKVKIPDSITEIAPEIFTENYLTSVTMPSGITSIGDWAFGDNYLKEIEIPSLVTFIGEGAFHQNQLTNLNLPNNLTTIGDWTFYNNKLTNVNIPNSVNSIGIAAFNDNLLQNDQAFIYRRNGDGSLDYTTLIGYGGANKDNVQISNLVTSIGTYAFAWNSINSVSIPNSVTSIGEWGFLGNQLTNVVLPVNLTTISRSAFATNQLTTINIPNGVTSIDINAFRGNKLTSVILPNTITTIGLSAFENNLLTAITIPNSVTAIDYGAFDTNQLTSITFNRANTILGDHLLYYNNNYLRNVYTIGGAGTYTGTQTGVWVKN